MRVFALVVFVASVAGIVACAPPAEAAATLTGTYEWQGTVGPLEASFRPTETPDEYKVRFRFEFDGRWKTWKGVMRGDLSGGALEGRVEGMGKRAWNVRGTLAGDTFEARHFEIEGNGEFETGTLTLRRKPTAR